MACEIKQIHMEKKTFQGTSKPGQQKNTHGEPL